MRPFPQLCCIVGSSDVEEVVPTLLEEGIRWIQFRDKEKTRREVYVAGLKLREITRRYDALLIVNDYSDIALAVGADGVHLGQDDLPMREARKILGSRIIGISTHTMDEAVTAEKSGADYIGFGPIFFTSTKDAGRAKGVEELASIVRGVAIPVVAIGGISSDNAVSVLTSGCAGIAASSGFLRGQPNENVRCFLRALSVMQTAAEPHVAQ